MWKVAGSIHGRCCSDLYCARGAQGVLPCKGYVVSASHLILPSLTPLSVGDCGRMQLGVANCDTSVALLQVVDNLPRKQWYSRCSSGELLAMLYITFYIMCNDTTVRSHVIHSRIIPNSKE